MNNSPITQERFSQLLDAYGGHPRHWPEEERQAALQFLEHSTEAQNMHQQACQLDRCLDSLPLPPKLFKAVILASVSPPSWSQRLFFYKGYFWRPVMISLAALLLGIVIGLSVTSPFSGSEEELYLLALNEDLL